MRVITVGMCAAIAVYGLNIILGFTGQLSLAQGGFFGIGAYGVGLLTTDYDWSVLVRIRRQPSSAPRSSATSAG
jgi:branched-chain amino acid transport system permease protein